MEYIRVTKDNLEQEHICCAISNNKDVQVSSKKAWLADRFDDGLVFLKSVERGKCFIEYIPAENAWNPILAENYMYIDCLWVSGSFKGHGYSNDLLEECIKDSRDKGKTGLCILSSAKKRPFLSDPKYLAHKGFKVCDEADNGIQLWYLPFSITASSFGICRSLPAPSPPNSRIVRSTPIPTNRVTSCIIQVNVPLMASMFRFWKPYQRMRACRSKPSICKARRRRRTLRRLLPLMLFSVTANTSRTSR